MKNELNITKENKKETIVSFTLKIIYRLFSFFNSPVIDIHQENVEKMCRELDSMEKNSLLDSITLQKLLQDAKSLDSESIELKRRVIGLEYRTSGMNTDRISSEMMDALLEVTEQWMKKQITISQCSKSTLRQLLHETANYPKFVEILLQDKALQDAFFSWVIRDHISSSIFIEYPALQNKIVDSNLHIRVSHFKEEGLKIKYENVNKKIVTLLIEGKEVNILDGSQTVHLRGNWSLTIDEIFKIFKTKDQFCGNLEYTEEGVTNWNVYEWGYWDADQKKIIDVNFEQDNWWEELPVFNRISIDEATRELGHKLDGKNWAVAACSTRKYENLNLFDNHAFVKVFFPSSDGLGYSTLPLGKYAKTAPQPESTLNKYSMLCEMTPATLSFIDENIYYNFRQKVQYPFVMTPEQGSHFFEKVKEDIVSGKEGNFVYQIETENCAKWVQDVLVSVLGEENVPNLYKTFFLNTESKGLIGWLIKALRRLPKSVQSWFVTRLHIPLGAFKGAWVENEDGKEWVSLTTLPFWQDGMIYFPAFLNEQIKKGELLISKAISSIQATFKNWIKEAVKGIKEINVIVDQIFLSNYDPNLVRTTSQSS